MADKKLLGPTVGLWASENSIIDQATLVLTLSDGRTYRVTGPVDYLAIVQASLVDDPVWGIEGVNEDGEDYLILETVYKSRLVRSSNDFTRW